MCSNSASDFQVFLGGIDVRIERCLWHLDGEPKKDVASELCTDFTFDELMEVRDTLFERAVYMAEERAELGTEGASQDVNAYDGIHSPWSMIKRRVISPVSLDVCDLYLYIVNEGHSFPTRILKRNVMKPKDGFNINPICELSKISEGEENVSQGNGDQTNGMIEVAVEKEQADERYVNMDTNIENAKERRANGATDEEKNPGCINSGNGAHGQDYRGNEIMTTTIDAAEMDGVKDAVDAELNGEEEKDGRGDIEYTKVSDTSTAIPNNDGEREKCVPELPGPGDGNRFYYINEDNEVVEKEDGSDMIEIINEAVVENCNKVDMSNGDIMVSNYRVSESDDDPGKSDNTCVSGENYEGMEGDEYVGDNVRPVSMGMVDDVWEDEHYFSGPASEIRYTMFAEPPSFDDTIALVKILIEGENKEERVNQECDFITEVKSKGTNKTENETTPQTSLAGKTSVRARVCESETPYVLEPLLTNSSSGKELQPACIPQSDLSECNLSQESFLKEIQEIHDKLTQQAADEKSNRQSVQPPQSTPKTTELPERKKTSVEMATQTTPNVIPDTPVTRAEYQGQMEYFENAIIDHERRMRVVELCRNKNERKVDRIDADSYNQNQHLLTANATLANEVDELKVKLERVMGTIGDIQELVSTTNDGDGTLVRERREEPNLEGNRRPEPRAQTPEPPRATRNGQQAKRGGKQKASSAYESFMRAATKVVPNAVNLVDSINLPETNNENPNEPQREEIQPAPRAINDETPGPRRTMGSKAPRGVPELSEPNNIATPKAQRIPNADTARGRRVYGRRGSVSDNRGMDLATVPRRNMTTSTPIPEARENNLSWADEDNDDSKVIEQYLAGEKVNDTEQGATGGFRANEGGKQKGGRTANAKKVNFVGGGANTRRNENIDTGHEVTSDDGDLPQLPIKGGEIRFDGTKCIGLPQGAREKRLPADVGENNNPIDLSEQGATGGVTKTQRGQVNQKAQGRKSYNGARPKEPSNVRPVNAGSGEREGRMQEAPATYAEMAARGKWSPPVGKNKKRKIEKRSPTALPPLQGANVRPQRDVFVRGLATTGYTSKKEMAEAIKYYCEERGVATIYARIMVNAQEPGVANVKITVHEEDIDTILDPSFWPEKTTVREWFQNDRERRGSGSVFESRDMTRGHSRDGRDA